MKLSVIIPAYNEAKRLGACLKTVDAALRANARTGLGAEVIVVDNNSTDETALLAKEQGALVIFEPVNQIARARNAGALATTGEWLLFLDADTLLPAETLTAALAAMESGKVAGGTSILDYGKVPLTVRFFVGLCNLVIRCFKMTAGCFVFCRTEAFREIGGFDENFFAGEDAEFGKALKKWGRARGLSVSVLTRNPPLTSDRKFRLHGLGEVLLAVTRYVVLPRSTMRDKRKLAIFYDAKR